MTNQLTTTTSYTMPSGQIAELVEAHHDSVECAMHTLQTTEQSTFTQAEEKSSGDTSSAQSTTRGRNMTHADYTTIAKYITETCDAPLTIEGALLDRDAQGHFNLWALHRAAGRDMDRTPLQFLGTDTAGEYINALGQESVHVDLRTGDAYVHKSLALGYAYWIEPVFMARVVEHIDRSRSELMDLQEGSWKQNFEALKAMWRSHELAEIADGLLAELEEGVNEEAVSEVEN